MQDLSQYFNPAKGITSRQDIIDIVHAKPGVFRRSQAARLRHFDLRPYYLPDPPDPDDPTNVSDWVTAATVENNTSQDIHRQADVTMQEIPGIGKLNTLRDHIQFYFQFRNEFQEVLLDVPVGVFGFQMPDRTLFDSGNIWAIKGFDRTALVANKHFFDSYVIPTGYKITDAVRVLLMQDSLPPSQGGRQPAGSGTGGGTGTGSNLTYDWTSRQRAGAMAGTAVGANSSQIAGPTAVVGLPSGGVNYFLDDGVPSGYARALYTGPVPTRPTESIVNGAATGFTLGSDEQPGASLWNIAGAFPPGFGPGEVGIQGTFVPLGGQYGTLTPVTATGWPDPNNPGLTPAGCDDLGPNIPASLINLVDCPVTAASPLTFARGVNKLAAINKLLASINYWPLWVDESGVFRSSPMPYFSNFIPNSDWLYTTLEGSIIHQGAVQTVDATAIANVVQVVCENNGRLPLVSVAYNNSYNSAISTVNLGYTIPKFISDPNIASQEVCDIRAIVELQFCALAVEAVKWTTHGNPFHQTHDYPELNIYNRQGEIEIDSRTYPFQESYWKLDLMSGDQEHTAGRVVAL